jgi:hypothetical protein
MVNNAKSVSILTRDGAAMLAVPIKPKTICFPCLMCTFLAHFSHFIFANAPAQLKPVGSRQFSKKDDITKHTWFGKSAIIIGSIRIKGELRRKVSRTSPFQSTIAYLFGWRAQKCVVATMRECSHRFSHLPQSPSFSLGPTLKARPTV